MRAAALAFLGGILAVQQLPALPSPGWLPWLLVVPIAAAAWRWRWLVPLVFAVAGAAWATLYAGSLLTERLPAELEGRDIVVTGVVASLPRRRDRVLRFELDVERYHLEDIEAYGRLPQRLRLSWYDTDAALAVGERWRLSVRLKRPHGYQNPGGFDYEGWLFRHRIRATGYVRAGPGNVRRDGAGSRLGIDQRRGEIRAFIDARLDGHPAAGVVAALAVGVRDGIVREQWDVFRRTGTSHLVAISGLHVGLVAGLAYWVCGWLWRLPGYPVLWWPAPKVGALGALAAATAYAALAGFSIPTRRALIMLVVLMVGVLAGRRATPTHVLAAALLAVLALDPLAVMAPGFWLSFAAVAVIGLALGRSPRARVGEDTLAPRAEAKAGAPGRALRVLGGRLARWSTVQLAVSLGLAPLLLLFYQNASLVAPLANALAIPVVGVVVVPLTLAGVAAHAVSLDALAGLLLEAAASLVEAVMTPLAWLAGLDYAAWAHPAPPWWAVLTAMGGAALVIGQRAWTGRVVGVALLCPLLLVRPGAPAPGAVWLTVLDVGQGLAVVVRTHGHTLVYDAGARFGADFDLGDVVVLPYLRQAGVTGIDTFVVSHGDNDHIGGADALRRAMPTRSTVSSVPRRLPGAARCRAGQGWSWDDVRFEMLSPFGDDAGAPSGNDDSCVLRVVGRFGAVLLTGDIEAATEARLVRRYGARLEAAVLVVPHHGSRTSSSDAFIDAVAPGFAVVSAGYRSRYGHPHPDVVARYRDRGVALHNTADAGAVTLRMTPDGITAERYREVRARYWLRRCAPSVPRTGRPAPWTANRQFC